ncbi:MAG: DUF3024 domain-containing protein [Bacteroidales bacterium]|jgi:hypothetical protein|nr:DUF3024 domain-containing protein [Bacteroidales bacterium]
MSDEKKTSVIDLIEKQIQQFVNEHRPPVEIRDKLDLGYSYINKTVEIFEIRSRWDNEKIKIKSPVAKTKYVKSRGVWIVYWMRASGKWERYEPNPEINNILEFFEILNKDKYGCFWG